MALVGNCIPSKNNVYFEFPACYARVLESSTQNDGSGVTFIRVDLHADQTARQVGAQVVVSRIYNAPTVDLPAGEPIPAAYGWLKTQPDFAGWVDA